MKAQVTVIAAILFCSAAFAHSAPLSDHPFFPMLRGKWAGEGKLTDGTNAGPEQKVKETWTGTMSETGIFTIEGRRSIDGAEHDFSWEFHANAGLIEGQMKLSEPKLDLRFEAIVSDVDRTVTMTIPLNPAGSVLTIVNTLSQDGKTLTGTVEVKDETGRVTLKGSVTHHKQE